jgi:uncharacterized protein
LETCRRIAELVDFMAGRYSNAAEVGIGHFPDVAFELLKSGVSVFGTDIRPFRYPGLNVIFDDITEPDLALYRGIKLIYSMRPPPELIPYIKRLASQIPADCIIKPLSDEYPGGKITRHGGTTFYLWQLLNNIMNNEADNLR